MSALVSVCCASGALRRYERVDVAAVRLTHEAFSDEWGPDHELENAHSVVEEFRTKPDPYFAVTETPLLKPDHDAPWRCDPTDAA